MKPRAIAVLLAAHLSANLATLEPAHSGEPRPGVSARDLGAAVEYLASDDCEGRLTGSPGAERAAEFIASAFDRAGLHSAPGLDDYYQQFTFTSGVRLIEDENSLSLLPQEGELESSFALNEDFVPLTYSATGAAEAPVVFVGYGLVEPKDDGYDSYQSVEVEGKVVLCLRDIPEEVSSERRQELALYAGDRYKAKLAADRGAAAFLLVTGPNSPNGGELVEFRESDRSSSVPIPAISVSGSAASRILKGADLLTLQSELDSGELNPHSVPEEGHPIRVSAALEKVTGTCRNVVGILPPAGETDEYLLVGAHYDHIGRGQGLGSLAKESERGMIHNGADDNASGTATVLGLAHTLTLTDGGADRRGLVFACWSGEELGLVGSAYFTEHPPLPLEKIVGYFNFDMVGRLREDKLIVQAVASSPAWRELLESHNESFGFDLSLQNDPYLPTDLTSFYTRQIPGLAFFTDLHENYNRPTDDAETLDFEGMERIATFAEVLILEAAAPDRELAYARVEQSAPASGRMRRRVFTGVVPDFSASGDSQMLVSDVRPGGPADEAGIRGGDVIVEFAGKSIASLQDYSDALAGAKPGVTVSVVVERDGERIQLEITPRVRE